MPYIKQEDRVKFEPALAVMPDISGPGELNYLFTWLISWYISRRGLRYQTINDIIGAFECAKREFQRRIVDSYEDYKMRENGDV